VTLEGVLEGFSLQVKPVDLVVLVAYFAAVMAIGLWLGSGAKSVAEYAVGERGIPTWAVLLSIVATETSSVTFLSVPSKTFNVGGDVRFLQLAMGYLIGRIVVATVLLPGYFRGAIMSAYQLLGDRFGEPTRRTASILFLVTRTVADGLRLYLTAIALDAMTRIGMAPAILITGVTTIIYTYVGGVKAVVWTDVLQFFVYVAGAILAALVLTGKLGGEAETTWAFAERTGRLRLFDTDSPWFAGGSVWTGLIGGAFLTLATHGADQMMVQRYLCAKGQRQAAIAVVLSAAVVLVQFALFLWIGIQLAHWYGLNPPAAPLPGDQAFADFIVRFLPTGGAGFILAAVFSASMSTLSGSLNSSATALVTDLLPPPRGADERVGLWRIRLATAGFGAAQIGVAIAAALARPKQSIVDLVLEVAAFTTGIVLGLFFLGLTGRRPSPGAALVAFGGGILLMSLLKLGIVLADLRAAGLAAAATDPNLIGTRIPAWLGPSFLRGIGGNWFACFGSLTTLTLGLIASAVSPARTNR
jgi:SSS family transporter